ncbi:Uncharacterized protein FWK35_00005589 [Aphis craccivora]|uniref:Uncharacterized protein n=1 Tax=Aphis craccivora TaxID=307492 RepID=A0A6G0YTW2_APHCR|nr:Uncharacterized protein FWK35_00005589 [Aphis craccivora]
MVLVDKSIDRLIVLHKGKLTSKIKELRKRHKTSLEMSTNNVLKDGEGCWNVMASGHDDMYTVNKLKDSCDCQICNKMEFLQAYPFGLPIGKRAKYKYE